jgi:hypothetical protein
MIHLQQKRWRAQLTELIDQLDEGSIALILAIRRNPRVISRRVFASG